MGKQLPVEPATSPLYGRNWLPADAQQPPLARPALCPVIALATDDRATESIDVVARSRGEHGQLVAAINANPHAATVLMQVLRHNERCAVAEQLLAESLAYSTLQHGREFQRWLAAQAPRQPTADAGPLVVTERDGDRLTITLNRPARRNAYSAGLRDELCEALEYALADRALHKVVVRGAGPCFSAGGDLGEFGTARDAAMAHLVRSTHNAAALIQELGARIEFRLHGACVGAGIELPAFAGRVTASADATFRLPEVSMGLIPGAGGTASILARIGRQRLARMALLDEPVDAATALDWGLVDAIEAP